MSKETKGCCGFGCLISTTISVIFIWLAFRILNPTFSIEEFDVLTLKKPTDNHTIQYDLKLKNRNFNKGIYYDAVTLAFYYKPNRNVHIGNVTIAPFYQGYWKSTHRVGNFASKGVNLENVVATNGKALFRVELSTKVRYKSPLWKTKRHGLVVGADLKVNSQGSLIKNKGNGIKLSSAAKKNMGCLKMVCILSILVLIHFV